MEELTPVQAIQEELAKHTTVARQAQEFKTMMELPIWKEIIEEYFLKAYRETSAYNVGIMTNDAKDSYMYQITARSIFQRFCDGLIDDGKQASEIVNELTEELVNEQKIAEEG
ncbi:MAG: hypothetical protein GQ570_08425 [Helicobacteraceae bacterium]|nr:hypothetical protein [Helicobacteraceae bacterium]